MRDAYMHYINFKDDPLPVTNFSYRISKSSNIVTMRVTRNKQSLNYKIFDDFKLKMSRLSEWLELHGLASKKKNDSNDLLLKNLKAKFKCVATTAEKLAIPSPPQLTDSELPLAERKRNRRVEVMVCPIVNALAGRLLGAYDLGVATLRAVVYAGDKTSGDARSWNMISGDAKSWVKEMISRIVMRVNKL
ncbi:hypothetical protein Tco_0290327 [Tanacetum coccineum]